MLRQTLTKTTLAATLVTVGGLFLVAPVHAAPRAVMVEPIKDFEVVPQGEHIKHAFEIRNEGDETLAITDVRPACGCTVARYDKQIAPGGVGRIDADVDTVSFNGVIAKTISVYTNDPDNPRLELVVKADVRPHIAVEPGFARFSYVQGETVGVISQLLWVPDGGDVGIVKIDTPYDHINVRHREAKTQERKEGTGKQWVIDIELAADAPIGALRDFVEVHLDHPQQKKIQIPLSGFVRPRQHATPYELDVGELSASDLPRDYTVVFTNFVTEGVELTNIETGFDALTAEVTPLENTGHRFQVLLRITDEMPKGSFKGTVKIHSTDKKSPVFELPVTGKVL